MRYLWSWLAVWTLPAFDAACLGFAGFKWTRHPSCIDTCQHSKIVSYVLGAPAWDSSCPPIISSRKAMFMDDVHPRRSRQIPRHPRRSRKDRDIQDHECGQQVQSEDQHGRHAGLRRQRLQGRKLSTSAQRTASCGSIWPLRGCTSCLTSRPFASTCFSNYMCRKLCLPTAPTRQCSPDMLALAPSHTRECAWACGTALASCGLCANVGRILSAGLLQELGAWSASTHLLIWDRAS